MPTLKSYITGFILSVALTLAAVFIVQNSSVNRTHTLVYILTLAIVQMFVQLFFFLHLNKGSDRKWNIAVFISAASIILILVVGSVWIMNHLNYNMTPNQMNSYLIKTEGAGNQIRNVK